MSEIISRKEAKALGLKRYFTGLPCHYGHMEERWVGDRQCGECARIKCRKNHTERRLRDPDWAHRENSKRYWKDPNKWRTKLREGDFRYTAALKVVRDLGIVQDKRRKSRNAETIKKREWLAKKPPEYHEQRRKKAAEHSRAHYWRNREACQQRHRARSKAAVAAKRALTELGIEI